MPDVTVELFRCARRRECDERAFMLSAVGIASTLAPEGPEYVLRVALADAPAAFDHLRKYEREILSRPAPAPPAPRPHPHALLGSALYATVLFGVAFGIASGFGRLDAFDAGDLDASQVRSGQWWRVWTALTLHLDGVHLSANTAAGAWFGYLAGRLLGVGNAWLLVVIGGGLANWLEARLGPGTYRSAGASTAVFTALGLLSAYSWRVRFSYPQRWASRWGPLVAGIILLAWTGTGAEQVSSPPGDGPAVDIVAHALGFAVGLVLGAGAASQSAARMLNRIPQWLAGLTALAIIVAAWARALAS